uniref:Uncharacterized protein n=1 Tax=Labrus bergylta TaxID=56723 RepID=A0A3Q3F8V2_9LABR
MELSSPNWVIDSDLVCFSPSVHAAVIAINEAVDSGRVEVTVEALKNPNALLTDLQEALMSVYQEMLHQTASRRLGYTQFITPCFRS